MEGFHQPAGKKARPATNFQYLQEEGKKEVDGITWEKVGLRIRALYEPVSYTHLDVYKRQRSDCMFLRQDIYFPIRLCKAASLFLSYLHLVVL